MGGFDEYRERMPEEWATTQNDLGAALQALAEHTDDLLMLGRAVAAYREATKEITCERDPMAWAMTTANLGVARRKLAERSRDAAVARRAAHRLRRRLPLLRPRPALGRRLAAKRNQISIISHSRAPRGRAAAARWK